MACGRLEPRSAVKNLFDRDPPFSSQTQSFQVGYDPGYADPRGSLYRVAVGYMIQRAREGELLGAAMHLVIASVVLLACGDARAQAATTVVDVPTRDATQRFLYVRPDAPIANVVFLPGNTGILDIADDGSMTTLPGHCAPFARNRDAFAARRVSLALVDRTSDGRIRQVDDIREVVRHVRGRDDVPTWIAGGSRSTNAALAYVAQAPADEPLGLIVFSPGQPDAALAARIARPALVVFHERDEPALPFVAALFEALASPDKGRVALSGGVASDACGGHHLFRGIDAEFVAAVAGFVERHNPATRHGVPVHR